MVSESGGGSHALGSIIVVTWGMLATVNQSSWSARCKVSIQIEGLRQSQTTCL